MEAKNRIIRIGEVEQLTGRSRTSIWRDEKAGTFPRRVRIGIKAVGWHLSSVLEWVQTREAVYAPHVPDFR